MTTKNTKITKLLNNIITVSLYRPRTDPDNDQCSTAGYAYQTLKELELEVNDEENVLSSLRDYGREYCKNSQVYLK